jgi:nucleoside-diphosphate-sugar epimerase
MSNIILTGSTGFVGRNLAKYLKDDFAISALDLRSPHDINNFNGMMSVIHLAGKAHDLRKSADDSEYVKVNTNLTKQLFNLFLQSDARDFIYFSSVKAVADTVEDVLTETVLANPLTPYGKSKQLAEDYLLSKLLQYNKRLFIIRPCMIHGPGNKGNLNLLYSVVKKGIPYPLAAFNNKRSFLSIANLNYIIERLISDETIPGGVYNVSDDEPLSTNQVIEIISNATGRIPKLWKINKALVKGLASIGDKLHLPLNSERLKKLTESYVVSNDKIKAALGIHKLPVSSTEGLITTIKSFSS